MPVNAYNMLVMTLMLCLQRSPPVHNRLSTGTRVTRLRAWTIAIGPPRLAMSAASDRGLQDDSPATSSPREAPPNRTAELPAAGSTWSRPPRPSRSWSICRAWPRMRCASSSRTTLLIVVGSKRAPRCAPRAALPPSRAQLRALRARGPLERRRRRRRARAAIARRANCASCCPRRRGRRGARCRPDRATRAEAPDDPDPLHRRHRRQARARARCRRALAALVAHRGIDLVIANVENAAAGFGITRDWPTTSSSCGVHVMTGGNHIWDKKEILDYIAERAAAAAAGELPRRARPGAAASSCARGRRAGRRHQRHGPRVHDAARRSVRASSLRRDRGAARKTRDRLRRLPRRGHLREDRDGLAPRRPRDGGRRHAHARADGRRAGAARTARPTSPTSA